ncbi:8121_t:CDS:2, partial [Racocetra fulgida]
IENDTLTISDEFSVLPTEKDNNEPIIKGEFTALTNGKSITILLFVYNKDKDAKLQIANSLKKK